MEDRLKNVIRCVLYATINMQNIAVFAKYEKSFDNYH